LSDSVSLSRRLFADTPFDGVQGFEKTQRLDGIAFARPALDSTSAWLYLGDRDILHLIESPTVQTTEEPQLAHFALRASGYQNFIANLEARGIPYRDNTIEDAGIRQLHLCNPDGNHLEINFALDGV